MSEDGYDEQGYPYWDEEGQMAEPTYTPMAHIQAEESLLGACLLSAQACGVAEAIVSAGDFYVPANGHVYTAIMELHDAGKGVDPVTVAEVLKRHDLLEAVGGPATLVNLQAATPATSNAGRYAHIIARYSDLRRIQRAVSSISGEVAANQDPDIIVEGALSSLREIGAGRSDALPSDVYRMVDFLNRPAEQRPDWIIPGIIRVGWRIILTATEGAGKTYLLRQLAASAAAGIHAFDTSQNIPPKRVLLVDLENPAEHIDNSMGMFQAMCEKAPEYNPDNFMLWHAPGGIDLRSRSDRSQFDNLLREFNPDLVCLGPIYKSYSLSARETDEIAVREVQRTLDDLRTRHQFGLIMEHHSAKSSGGNKRSLDPYGTVFWMRWPELGIGMEARLDSDEVVMGRWRGDRLPNGWPDSVFRSTPWPWTGRWENGMPRHNGGTSEPVLSVSAPKLRRPPERDDF